MTINAYIERCNALLQDRCANLNLPDATLQQAITYSMLSPGKRLRAALVYATADAFNKSPETVDSIACAIEAIHCYSLIHDDLPAMDDDDMRRGQPSCHKKFNTAVAILAGDGLQSLAFRWINECPALSAEQCRKISYNLALAIGPCGMVGGQAMDINHDNALEKIHYLKTGALIAAAVESSAIACNASAQQINSLREYSSALGLGYQLRDDILDSATDTQPNSCQNTSIPEIEAQIKNLIEQAHSALSCLGASNHSLTELISLTLLRSK